METEDLKLYRDSAWTDLKVRFCGHSKCLPLHTYGPGSRPYYLMHFVFSGKGRLIVNQTEYQVEAGQLFLVEPNQMVFYQADEYDPWSYSWVGFQGTLAKHFLGRLGLGYPALTRIISGQILCEIKDLLCQMAKNHGDKVSDDLYINGLFLILLSKIQTANAAQNNPNISGNPAESFVQQAVSIVENFYGTELTVNDIAKKLNLNRSYLSTIFENIQEFL